MQVKFHHSQPRVRELLTLTPRRTIRVRCKTANCRAEILALELTALVFAVCVPVSAMAKPGQLNGTTAVRGAFAAKIPKTRGWMQLTATRHLQPTVMVCCAYREVHLASTCTTLSSSISGAT